MEFKTLRDLAINNEAFAKGKASGKYYMKKQLSYIFRQCKTPEEFCETFYRIYYVEDLASKEEIQQ